MIIRLVHMEFAPEQRSAFLDLFEAHREAIASQPGCQGLELVQNEDNQNKISTLSHWKSTEALNKYRASALFAQVWPATKALFSAPPQAQSFKQLWSCS
jgi:quinol monooxygenase YgiN